MKQSIDYVKEFHKMCERPEPTGINISNKDLNELGVDLLREEVKELEDALAAGNVVDVLDALADIQYILDGRFIDYGLASRKDEAMRLVHESNMSKLGLDGKPVLRGDGKILKGPNYKKVDLSVLFE